MSDLGRLERLNLKGFKSIRSLSLQLRPLNLVIGANGAGKSNFMEFFRFMNHLLEKDLQGYVKKRGKAEKFLHFGSKVTSAIEIRLDFPPNSYRAVLGRELREGGLLFDKELCEFHGSQIGYTGGRKTHRLAKPGAEETGLPDVVSAKAPGYRYPPDYVVGYISDWKLYHFHDTSENAPVKGFCRIWDSSSLSRNASNLAAFLYRIHDKSAYKRIVKTIKRVAPFFHDFILEPDKADPYLIRLRWRHVGSDEQWDAHDLSDGTLRFICLTTLLLQPDPPTMILLDEPELGLHPYALGLLGDMMRIAAEKTQIIASTQSVTLANQFAWEDLVIVERQENSSIFRRLQESEIREWLEQYGAEGMAFGVGDLWEKNLLGGNPA